MSRRINPVRYVPLTLGAIRPGDPFLWPWEDVENRAAWMLARDVHHGEHDGATCPDCATLPPGTVRMRVLRGDGRCSTLLGSIRADVIAVVIDRD